MASLTELLELHRLAKNEGGRYEKHRPLLQDLLGSGGKHFIGIAGPRGAGKTVLLRQYAHKNENAFYLSLDTNKDGDLFELAKKLNMDLGFTHLLLDEVHCCKEYDELLKRIYDFLDVRVIFASSVSLSIFRSSYDLSRRISIRQLYPFSFREFIFFKTGEHLSELSIEDIVKKRGLSVPLRHANLFDEYLKGGVLPFALDEPDPLPLLKDIVKKVISGDIPGIAKIQVDEIELLEKTLGFIGRSEVDGINYSSISRNVGVTKYKAAQYMELLEKAFIIHQVFPRGTNVLKEPKILMALPYRLLYRDMEDCIGPLREDFFAGMMRAAGIPFHYLKTRRGAKTPDYLIPNDNGDLVIEIGGRGKGPSQFKGIEAAEKLIFYPSANLDGMSRPLESLGFLC
ncbi:MAG TPA: AAA family ATPase [Thermovirgaceae bacterium]|nr:AAA family ATPase [Thermovirgaceae bacterium]